MRVIAGKWKGRRLTAPSGQAVRPTTDRVKEAMFNILGPSVLGARVLDLCCGTGALGIEALSRGAAQVVFVDQAGAALSATEQNLVRCGASTVGFRLVRGDARSFLESELKRPSESPWLFLCDPPYAADLAHWVLTQAGALGSDASCRGAIVELSDRSPGLASSDDSWEFRSYGKTVLAVFRPPTPGVENV